MAAAVGVAEVVAVGEGMVGHSCVQEGNGKIREGKGWVTKPVAVVVEGVAGRVAEAKEVVSASFLTHRRCSAEVAQRVVVAVVAVQVGRAGPEEDSSFPPPIAFDVEA